MMAQGKQTIGLYFGTFNPIHIGHMAVANYLVSYANLDGLWFVVTPQSPFKQKQSMLPDRQRLEMVHRAIGNDLRFKASDIEFYLPQPNFTAYTIKTLLQKFPDKAFALIMGEDNLAGFDRWKNYEYLLKYTELLVYPRPGFDAGKWKEHASVRFVKAPHIEVSSSFIRAGIKAGKDLRHFMPEPAWSYAEEMGFYR